MLKANTLLISKCIQRCALKNVPSTSIISSRSFVLKNYQTSYKRFNSTNTANKPEIKTEIKNEESNSIEEIPSNKRVKITVKKAPLWDRVKHEAKHYWDGTKLLGLETKISFKLLLKLLAGYELTRREMLQFKRTTQDIVRLVPFAAFVIIPFAELLLPVALKIFPNLLPSTYESQKEKISKLESLRKTRRLMSKFMNEKKPHFKPTDITDDQKIIFNNFYRKVFETGKPESREQLIQVARLYKDDTVLDNVTRPYLIALAKYINLKPFGTDVMLRYRIRSKLLELRQDDLSIFYEGVDQLTPVELLNACSSRGIRSFNVKESILRDNLKIWLNMRIKDKIPSTLLVMATASNYGDITSSKSLYDALCDTLSSVPDELYDEVKVNVVQEGESHPSEKIAHLKDQVEFMKDEAEQQKTEPVSVKDDLSLDEVDVQQQEQVNSKLEPVESSNKKDEMS
ncbi:hypothetical protein TBLA_0C05410 [Henningerozyma blattae CBS 6284]|uniref:Letm1 RBD domain-containing protein n=1 Tax=Henningerozyma blattae (strain ATCC 34711 / CBS 6284 / DSM 70876 / NBRC 10599 / NRRL Y-10934 / UCD 77-7) TaxID=1071380 RepID=I2H1T7_HENB6|nr:hypothetical protein TBLA_0C05410 [Tetrapisispora blattae CBS 6284]CCH60339.1 hypothetical protein TBLA_0C05410 [Tetrapisispora blattae CBS 6284]